MEKWMFEPDIFTDSDFYYEKRFIKFIMGESKKECVEKALSFIENTIETIGGKEHVVKEAIQYLECSKKELSKFEENEERILYYHGDMGNQSIGFMIYPLEVKDNVFSVFLKDSDTLLE